MTLSRKPLKGMRQLYPGERRVEDYIVSGLTRAGRAYGFEEYEGPVLEPLELFLAKSGSELAREQSYNFTDKGGRELILRPELTPSLARMIAAGGELIYPVRWMSVPLCFRYERPQRGRVREFLQFNLDILGAPSPEAELEVILVLNRLMRGFGAVPGQFEIRYSSRKLASAVLARCGLKAESLEAAFAVIDKRDKLPSEKWESWVREIVGDSAYSEAVIRFSRCRSLDAPWLVQLMAGDESLEELREFSRMLDTAGVEAAVFDPGVVRGLDYYTGIVFEVMDTGSENRRALCGGGRYDDLVGLFGGRGVSGVGFGLGILTLKLFLETYDLLPAILSEAPPVELFIAALSQEQRAFVLNLAEKLRNDGLSVETGLGGKNLRSQFTLADKRCIEFIAVVGPREIEEGRVNLKRSGREDLQVQMVDLAEAVRAE